jgi:hypothetical protein
MAHCYIGAIIRKEHMENLARFDKLESFTVAKIGFASIATISGSSSNSSSSSSSSWEHLEYYCTAAIAEEALEPLKALRSMKDLRLHVLMGNRLGVGTEGDYPSNEVWVRARL